MLKIVVINVVARHTPHRLETAATFPIVPISLLAGQVPQWCWISWRKELELDNVKNNFWLGEFHNTSSAKPRVLYTIEKSDEHKVAVDARKHFF